MQYVKSLRYSFLNDKHEEIIYVITQNKLTISIFEAQLRDFAKHIEAHSKNTILKTCIALPIEY